MLHARLCSRQVRGFLLSILMAVGLCAPQPPAAAASEDLAKAEMLARSGEHAAAAKLYEKEARHFFSAWDTRLALLAAREYLQAGQTADAERVLGKVASRARGDDAILMARIQAEIALARGDGNAALAALATIPEPWPAPLAAELLLLEARAQFLAGRTLDAIHTLEERGQLVGTVDAREANDRLLLDSLQRSGAAFQVPPGATDDDRAWIELAQLRAAAEAGDPAAAQRAADWRARHPNHRGAALLPAPSTVAMTAAAPGAPPPLPEGVSSAIALLLPLTGRQEAIGAAVRDGFLAGYLALTEPAPRVLIYDTVAQGADAAYRQALADGARFVVGPLTKEDVGQLAATQQLPVPTLALNDDGIEGIQPAFLYQFSLDPEQEARAVAQRIAADGRSRGIALFPRNSWGERVYSAFTAELATTGVQLMAAEYYEPGERDYSGPLRLALGRFGGAGDRRGNKVIRRDSEAEALEGPQFAFIAATPQVARAIRPQLRFQMAYDVAIYATSDAWDPSVRSAADLEGMTYPEMPWILHEGQGAPALWDVLQHQWAAEGRGRLRLYAFGYDAVALMSELRSGRVSSAVDGLTGRLTFAGDGRVRRELDWARIEGGSPQPAGTGAMAVPVVP